MSNTILLKHIAKHTGQKITLKGWIYNKRTSGKIAFLQFRDGTGTVQAVAIKSALDEIQWQHIQSVTFESSVILEGLVKADSRAPSGYELELNSISIIQLAPDDYPIGKKEHGVDFLLTHRHYWLRTPKQRAIQIIRDVVVQSIQQFYHQSDYTQIDTPIFTANACEDTTDLFQVDYFGEPAYLSQSGQLYLEACLPSFNRVYDFQPVFRAEKSKTRRHLTEFWMTNAEAAFVDHKKNLDIQQDLIHHVFNNVLQSCQAELSILDRDPDALTKVLSPFPRLSHKQAVVKLQKLGSSITIDDDLGAEDETLLTKNSDVPIFVEYYPAKVKAFYMKRHKDDNSLALCADLIAPEGHGEIIGGSQREDDYDKLKAQIIKHKLPLKDFTWYLDQRLYGSTPHSGYGVGIERLVKWICNLPHVRETIPFPRMLTRLRP